MITNMTLKLVEAKKTTEWKPLAEKLCKEYRTLRLDNTVDTEGEYDEKKWKTYLTYLKLESICLKFAGKQRRSFQMKNELLKICKEAVEQNITLI